MEQQIDEEELHFFLPDLDELTRDTTAALTRAEEERRGLANPSPTSTAATTIWGAQLPPPPPGFDKQEFFAKKRKIANDWSRLLGELNVEAYFPSVMEAIDACSAVNLTFEELNLAEFAFALSETDCPETVRKLLIRRLHSLRHPPSLSATGGDLPSFGESLKPTASTTSTAHLLPDGSEDVQPPVKLFLQTSPTSDSSSESVISGENAAEDVSVASSKHSSPRIQLETESVEDGDVKQAAMTSEENVGLSESSVAQAGQEAGSSLTGLHVVEEAPSKPVVEDGEAKKPVDTSERLDVTRSRGARGKSPSKDKIATSESDAQTPPVMQNAEEDTGVRNGGATEAEPQEISVEHEPSLSPPAEDLTLNTSAESQNSTSEVIKQPRVSISDDGLHRARKDSSQHRGSFSSQAKDDDDNYGNNRIRSRSHSHQSPADHQRKRKAKKKGGKRASFDHNRSPILSNHGSSSSSSTVSSTHGSPRQVHGTAASSSEKLVRSNAFSSFLSTLSWLKLKRLGENTLVEIEQMLNEVYRILRTCGREVAWIMGFIFFFPEIVKYTIGTYAPSWASVCLFYAFLIQVLCTEHLHEGPGGETKTSFFRKAVPLAFLLDGVSHPSLLLGFDRYELLITANLLLSIKLVHKLNPAIMLSAAMQVLFPLLARDVVCNGGLGGSLPCHVTMLYVQAVMGVCCVLLSREQ